MIGWQPNCYNWKLLTSFSTSFLACDGVNIIDIFLNGRLAWSDIVKQRLATSTSDWVKQATVLAFV